MTLRVFFYSAAIALFSPGAAAQPADNAAQSDANAIVITGTLLRGIGPVGAHVLRLDREVIEAAGVSNTTELLRQLPQIQNLGADESHLNASQAANTNFTVGAGINLRGLGTESTLLLLNGRRIPASGTRGAFTDPSLIPLVALQSIEVVSDGATATYGSDAVGGVINFTTRKNTQALETRAAYGAAAGIEQKQFSQFIGIRWGGSENPGWLSLAYEHQARSVLLASDRPAQYTDDFRLHGGPDLRSTNANPGTIQVGSTTYAIPANQNGVGLSAAQLVANTANRQSSNLATAALPGQTRDLLWASIHQQLSPRLKLTIEALDSKRAFLRYASLSNQTIIVPKSNPFFVSPVANAQSVSINYSFIPVLGAQKLTGYAKLNTLGVTANLTLGSDWQGELFVSQGRDWERRWTDNSVNVAALSAALADNNPATAFNPFADGSVVNTNNAATLDKIRANAINAPSSELFDGGFKADGPIAAIGGGTIELAIGGEIAKNIYRYAQYQSTTTPNNSVFAEVINLANRRSVSSLFAEIYAPLIGANNATPWARQLDISLAARYDRHSNFAARTSPKIGLRWRLFDQLELRATYGRAFRVPNASEQSPEALGTISLNTLTDPASSTGNALVVRVQGGNPRVKPETASVSTWGITSHLGDTTMALDYFHIDYRDRLATPGNDSFILTKLASLGRYVIPAPTASQVNALTSIAYFQGVKPDPATIKYIVDAQSDNFGSLQTRGLDFALHTQWQDASNALWKAAVGGTVIFNYKLGEANLVNTINNPVRFRSRGELSWQRGEFRVSGFVNFINAYTNNGVLPVARVAANTTVDMSAQYDFGNVTGLTGLSLTVSAQNLANRQPPYVQNGNFSFDAQNASAIGRWANVSVSKEW